MGWIRKKHFFFAKHTTSRSGWSKKNRKSDEIKNKEHWRILLIGYVGTPGWLQTRSSPPCASFVSVQYSRRREAPLRKMQLYLYIRRRGAPRQKKCWMWEHPCLGTGALASFCALPRVRSQAEAALRDWVRSHVAAGATAGEGQCARARMCQQAPTVLRVAPHSLVRSRSHARTSK